ncbi:SAM-dependent methyltransferase [Phyllobacteriaceae bacterium JZ32]
MNRRLISTAVKARRHEPANSLDYFPTPPWATRAFAEHVMPVIMPLPDRFACSAYDPACGEGHMSGVLEEYFGQTHASDVFDYGQPVVADFLDRSAVLPDADWIVSNPPFNLGAEFIRRALECARVGIAMLVRTQFLEGQDRHRSLFTVRAPDLIAQFVERVPMHRGRWVVNGKTATSYCWLVWRRHREHDRMRAAAKYGHGFIWIPPCRRRLTRSDDVLRFRGCMDIPKKHPAYRPERKAA